jgi:hypothetical protein
LVGRGGAGWEEKAGERGEGRGEKAFSRLLTLLRWDKSKEALLATLHVALPNFFPKTENPPIPDNPPNPTPVFFLNFFEFFLCELICGQRSFCL